MPTELAPGRRGEAATTADRRRAKAMRLPASRTQRGMWLLAAAIILLIFGVPLVVLLVMAFRNESGGYGLDNLIEIATSSRYLIPIWNSLRVSLLATIIAAVMGIPMAWLCSKTNVPGRTAIRVLVYSSFIMPPLLGAIAWVYLASPRAGVINRSLDSLIGVSPLNVFDLNFMAFVMALYLYSYVFTFAANSFDNVGGELDEAGAILGASTFRRARTIVLPLGGAAILNALILVFVQAMSLFGVPAIIAVPSGNHVMTTQLARFFSFPPQPELAAAFGIPLVVFAYALFVVRKYILGKRGFVTVGGKGAHASLIDLGRWRWLASTWCWIIIGGATFLPFFALLTMSMKESWGRPGSPWTFEHLLWVGTSARDVVQNSIVFSAAAATICVIVGFIVAYLRERTKLRIAKTLDSVMSLSIAVPGIVLAIGLFAAYSRPPIFIYGTALIMIWALAGRFMSVALQNIGPGLKAIHGELNDAARIVGAGEGRAILGITLPLAAATLFSAWIFTFVLSSQELSATVLLANINTEVIPTRIVSLYDTGSYERIAALGVVLIAIILTAVAFGNLILIRRLRRFQGG